MAATLNGEVNTLGYPKAALFAFCVALVSYNMMSVVKAALRTVHGAETVQERISGYYLADEITMTHRGMMIAIPEDEWVVFHDLTPVQLGAVLVELAKNVRLALYTKQPRGPKKPQPKKQSGAKIKHVSTARILNARQTAQNDTFKRLGYHPHVHLLITGGGITADGQHWEPARETSSCRSPPFPARSPRSFARPWRPRPRPFSRSSRPASGTGSGSPSASTTATVTTPC